MPARLNHPKLIELYNSLRSSGPRGRELADVLDRYNTRVRFASLISGGFTLNFINTIFLQPLRPDASDWEYKYHVTLLGHEACHVEQRFWVDSVEQEIRAYASQVRVAIELGFDLGVIRQAFEHLDPASLQDRIAAQAAMLALFAGTPAAMVYAALPLVQPIGLRAAGPAIDQIIAVARAGLRRPQAK